MLALLVTAAGVVFAFVGLEIAAIFRETDGDPGQRKQPVDNPYTQTKPGTGPLTEAPQQPTARDRDNIRRLIKYFEDEV
ncbi:MAG: hypothetical protein GYB64_01610 [Chloroflexi bacterium]|nr:hypothetical protein [Chloroflexota bacterium]